MRVIVVQSVVSELSNHQAALEVEVLALREEVVKLSHSQKPRLPTPDPTRSATSPIGAHRDGSTAVVSQLESPSVVSTFDYDVF